MAQDNAVRFWEQDLLVKTLEQDHELQASYRLRHRVFAEQLKWVPSSADGREVDAYDACATAVGLFASGERLLGLFRLLNSTGPFMMESEFRSCLSPAYELRKASDTVEITRLTVDPTLSEKGLSTRLMLVLFKGVYHWSLNNDVRYLYMVVEKRFLRALRAMGFPCEAISPAIPIPPAEALSIAAILDWDRFREECPAKQPAYFEWFSSISAVRSYQRSEFSVPELSTVGQEHFAGVAA